ncbi:MAG TPA: SDR family oxidoreductase [Polyangiaceae bacterium]|nr:SDR family oxidoreductase [Polyangiaceae bacterium]
MTNEMKGQTCVVTGASGGIGRETARALASRGARVVLVCRDRAKGEATRAELGAGGGEVDLELCDLSSQASIRELAGRLERAHARIDVLVNNAGLIIPKRTTTADGLEATFALNHLGYFLLTTRLLDLLRASAPARIVNVSSEAHRRAALDFDDLQSERSYGAVDAYCRSKLANVYFTYELAERLRGSGVTANCLHPGVVASGFGRHEPGLLRVLATVARPFLIDEAKGAKTSVYLASSPEVEGVTGKYFVREREKRSSPASYDVGARKRLWEASEALTAPKG